MIQYSQTQTERNFSMKIYRILKSLTDPQLDKLMEIMHNFNFNVSQALIFGYDDIISL